ncbi:MULTISPECIES: type II CAAX prenyl endopeptidase Rce1 family protein [unclassified Nocardia]|uniref:CPBP family glutamic-type intramembrane protease n=1 Tax=unclassified Nocardia TaxID=2637762 RepID=UPI001CE439F0|nr:MULTISPECIES: CPBP family glutamic-type intramembrane protease [unclassified Nocardia]
MEFSVKAFCVIGLIYLAALEPWLEARAVRTFMGEYAIRDDARVRLYREGVFRTWFILAVIVIAFAINGTSLTRLGLGGFDTTLFHERSRGEQVLGLVLIAAYICYLLGPVVLPLTGRRGRDFIARNIEYVVFITPATAKERVWWVTNSFSTPAEEIIYRGFTLYAVEVLWPGVPFWWLVVLGGGVIEGARHIVRPAVAAQVVLGATSLAVLYKFTGALWPVLAVKLFHDLRVLAFPLTLARKNMAARGLSEIPGKTLDDERTERALAQAGGPVEARP